MTSLPPFLRKLWSMVNDPKNQAVINWVEDGDGFVVIKPKELGNVLTKYYNGNTCSFVRQLNLYGFNKIGDEFMFKHFAGHFKRDEEEKLYLIERRKNIKTKTNPEGEPGASKSTRRSKQTKFTSEYPNTPTPDHPSPKVPSPDDTLGKLIQSNNTHEFMINLLVKELQNQQRETAYLRQQLTSLTQYVISQTGNLPPQQIGNSNTTLFTDVPLIQQEQTIPYFNTMNVNIAPTEIPATNPTEQYYTKQEPIQVPNYNQEGPDDLFDFALFIGDNPSK